MKFRVAPALLLCLAACAHQAPPAAPVPLPSDPAPAAPATSATTPPTSDTGPFLIDPGAEPRNPLRYRIPAGTLRTMAMTYDMTMTLPGGTPTVAPTMLFTGSYDILEVADDGTFKSRLIFDDTDVRDRDGSDPAMAAPVRAGLEKLEHLQVLATFDERGQVLTQEVDAGTTDPATAQLVQQQSDSLKSVMTRLPLEAIGRGARWTSTGQVTNNGIRIDTETEFEALEVTATTMRLRATMKVVAPRQPMAATGPEPITVEGTGSGTSEIWIDLTTMVSDVTVRSDLVMTLSSDDSSAEMSMDQQITMQFR